MDMSRPLTDLRKIGVKVTSPQSQYQQIVDRQFDGNFSFDSEDSQLIEIQMIHRALLLNAALSHWTLPSLAYSPQSRHIANDNDKAPVFGSPLRQNLAETKTVFFPSEALDRRSLGFHTQTFRVSKI
jgi:hypothetical protein